MPLSQKQSIMQTTAKSLQHQQLQNDFQTRPLSGREYISSDCQTCAKVSGRNSFYSTHPCLLRQWISVISSGKSFYFFRTEVDFFLIRLLITDLGRGVLLSPSPFGWCCTVTGQVLGLEEGRGHHGTVSFQTGSLSHIHTELDWCGTCAPPALLCCSTVSHISVWKNGQRSGE